MPVSKPNILLLGGITEAYELAEQLCHLPLRVITSLAGRTQTPRLPQGEWRSGGFGGVDGLIHYLTHEKIDFIIDATHPFAFEMTKNALAAAQATGIPLIRLERPLWQKQVGDNWTEVETLEDAAKLLPKEKIVFLALGRQHLAPFLNGRNCQLIARMIEKPEMETDGVQIILAKPGTTEEEKAFLKDHHIDIIVARNSGGKPSYGKIAAARELGLPVIMISRAPLPQLQIVETVDAAANAVCQAFRLSE